MPHARILCFWRECLVACLENCCRLNPHQAIESIDVAVREFARHREPSDDLTLVVLGWAP